MKTFDSEMLSWMDKSAYGTKTCVLSCYRAGAEAILAVAEEWCNSPSYKIQNGEQHTAEELLSWLKYYIQGAQTEGGEDDVLSEAYKDGKREGYLAALGDVERELETTIEESGFMVDESDKGYTIKLCEWLKKNLSKLKFRAGEE